MKRLVAIPLAVALLLSAPSVFAGKLTGTATLSIDNATPSYGDFVTVTAEVTSTGDLNHLRTVCTHEFGQSFSSDGLGGNGTLEDVIGLYAPNWPSGAATCVSTVYAQNYGQHGNLQREIAIGSLAFEVAA